MEEYFLTILLAPFLVALVLPGAARWLGPKVGWLALVAPVASFIAVLAMYLAPGEARTVVQWDWLPSLGVTLTFNPDGLALFFGMVVSGIGVLVTFYAVHYLDDHYRDHGRFYCYLMLFMGAMLLTVFSANLLVLFVAWELTGLTSFLLIGFLHEKDDSQRGARMALLTTALTGLALLAGVVLLRLVFGSYELAAMVGAAVPEGKEGLLSAAFLCCFVGIAGKSAQFPFHYWLPNAMAAPTPVSAYLHSAAMVKLGVFLTARLLPVFNGLESWTPVLTTVGFGTLLLGAVLALLSQDLKGVLAYTTVAQLGLLVGHYGLFSRGVPVTWDYLHIINHVFYKACLFMVVGIVDHAAGTRDQRELGGLFRAMPVTGTAALIGAAALASLPPTTGFLSEEMLLKSVFAFRDSTGGVLGWWPVVAVVLASVIKATIAAGFLHRVFFGQMPRAVADRFHSPSIGLQLSPLALALAALVGGCFAENFGRWTSSFEIAGTHGGGGELHLWHGLTREFVVGVAIMVVGVLLYFVVGKARWARMAIPTAARFDLLFERIADGTPYLARRINRGLGFETPHAFLFVTLAAMVAVVATAVFLTREGLAHLPAQWEFLPRATEGWIRWGIVTLIAIAAVAAVRWQQPIRQLFALSLIGAGTTAYFVLYRAPDLALTQMLVETITLLLVLLVVLRLKRDGAEEEKMKPNPPLLRAVRVCASLGFGLILGGGVLLFQQPRTTEWAGAFYLENAIPLAKGTNAVNTVVVDFRGWDTLWEIAVLLIAGIGALGLLARRRGSRDLNRKVPSKRDLFPVPPDLILKAVALAAFVPLNLFSLQLFFRGHNLPGGGFIAGLVTALSLLILVFVIGVHGLRRLVPFNPLTLAVFGVSLAMGIAVLPALQDLPLLNHLHLYLGSLYVGTPVFFDLGVFLAVVGVALKLILPLMNSVHGMPAFVVEEEGAFMSSLDEPIDVNPAVRAPGKGEHR
jgi:NADH:ubiquinone oxidoreductase subunit 5 (subunit L)/multisubunit Na+/H+ antiporter MnhA subunit/multisubunit Na+/H+ antiporter MnhB subunit